MGVPVKITSRHIELSNEMISRIERSAEALGRFREDILWCNVVVASPHKRRRRGRRFDVRVRVAVPEGVALSDRRSSAGVAEDNLEVAVAHAFRAVRRQIAAPGRRSGTCLDREDEPRWQKNRRGRRGARRRRSWPEVPFDRLAG